MNRVQLREGMKFKFNDHEHRIVKLIGKTYQVENLATGIFSNVSVEDFVTLQATQQILFSHTLLALTRPVNGETHTQFLNDLPQEEQIRAKRMRIFLEWYITHYGDRRSKIDIKKALDNQWVKLTKHDKIPSVIQTYRLLRRYVESDKAILSLICKTHQRGNKKPRVSQDVLQICLDAIHRIFMSRTQGTKKETHFEALADIAKENELRPRELQLAYPSINMISNLIAKINPYDIHKARHGEVAARHRFRHVKGHAEADRPNEVWEIDHVELDLIIVDERTGLPIGRPWLTLIVDRKTKCIVGFHLSFRPPSHASVAAALCHAISPKYKDPAFAKGNILNKWNIYGIPLELVMDNGLEFHGSSLEAVCLHMGITMRYCASKEPWLKGTVERVQGTLNRAICGLIPGGRTFHNIQKKGDYDSLKTACVSLEQLRFCIVKWIVDVYHETIHSGLQTTPREMWATLIGPDELMLPISLNDLGALTGQIDHRKVWHYGIEINNVIYNCPELGEIRSLFKGKATVRWNDEEMGHIYVMKPAGGILKVPADSKFSFVRGLSYYTYQAIRNYLETKGETMDEISLAKRTKDIREEFLIDSKRNKTTRRNLKRLHDGLRDEDSETAISDAIEEKSFTTPIVPPELLAADPIVVIQSLRSTRQS